MYWTIFTCREVIIEIEALPNIQCDVECKHGKVSNCHFQWQKKIAVEEEKNDEIGDKCSHNVVFISTFI